MEQYGHISHIKISLLIFYFPTLSSYTKCKVTTVYTTLYEVSPETLAG